MIGPERLRVAVLLTYECQFLDMVGVDLFGMMSKDYLDHAMLKPIADIALDVEILYIGKDGSQANQTALRPMTGQARIQAEVSVNDTVVQPGAIDILLIPGPDPSFKQTKQTLDFVRAHGNFGTTILTVCSGCTVAAAAGVLDNLNASGTRPYIPQLRKDYPLVKWDDTRRFVKATRTVKGKTHEVWSSGGITNGLEMIAAFLKEKYPGPLSETVCTMADVGEKGEYYGTSVSVDNAWWLGQILRAFLFGHRRPATMK